MNLERRQKNEKAAKNFSRILSDYKITQKEMGKMIHYSQQQINRLCSGESTMEMDTAKRISDVLKEKKGIDVSWQFLVGESDFMNLDEVDDYNAWEIAQYAAKIKRKEDLAADLAGTLIEEHGITFEAIHSIQDKVFDLYKIHVERKDLDVDKQLEDYLCREDFFVTALDFEEFLANLADAVHALAKVQMLQLLSSPKVARIGYVHSDLKERSEAQQFLLSFVEGKRDN